MTLPMLVQGFNAVTMLAVGCIACRSKNLLAALSATFGWAVALLLSLEKAGF